MTDPLTRRELESRFGFGKTLITFGALVLTVIGAAFYLGSTMATEDDVAGLRQELRELRERAEAQMQELRSHLVDHLDGHPTRRQRAGGGVVNGLNARECRYSRAVPRHTTR